MSRRVVACGELKAIMAEGVGKPSLNRATSRTRQTRNREIYPWPAVHHPVSGLPRATGRPIQTPLPYAFRHPARQLATRDNSPAHSSIGMPSGIPILADRHSPPTGCGHTVSGSISLPSRGSFHLSITVLVHYRSPRVFSLGRWSSQFPTGFHVSRSTQKRHPGSPRCFAYGAVTLYRLPFQGSSATPRIAHFPAGPQPGPVTLYNPARTTPAGYHARAVWALPRSLATTRGISFDFSSAWY